MCCEGWYMYLSPKFRQKLLWGGSTVLFTHIDPCTLSSAGKIAGDWLKIVWDKDLSPSTVFTNPFSSRPILLCPPLWKPSSTARQLVTSAFPTNSELLETVETALPSAQALAHNRCSISICQMLLNESFTTAYFWAKNYVDTVEI